MAQGQHYTTFRILVVVLAHPYPVQAKTFHCGAGDVPCLIAAINEANANGKKNRIRLEAGTYTLTTAYNESAPTALRNGLPEVTSALTIIGAGADNTSIESDASIPFFSRFFRILSVTATGTLTLEGLTIRGGFVGGVTGSGDGGISNLGTLTIRTSRITGNIADGGGGGIGNGGTLVITHSLIDRNGSDEGYGGGISNSGTLTIRKSTVTRNRSLGGSGIFNSGTLTISQSAIIENSTDPAGSGGGIWNGGGTLVIMNSTITDNSAPFGGAGGILASGTVTITNSTLADNSAGEGSEFGRGGGISAADGATVELLNTILARNTVGSHGAGPDCAGPITSLNNNLIGDPTDCTITLQPSDLTGDPGLGPFMDNGRPGNGHFPLLPTSQAIDTGNDAVCPRTDQLGQRRIGPCDIGAIRFLDQDDRRHEEEDDQHEADPAAAAQESQ